MPEDNEAKSGKTVVARHMIHRRNGDVFERIKPGTSFEVQDDDEMKELRASGSIYDSMDEKIAYERAAEGNFTRTVPGITSHAVPSHVLRLERAAENGQLSEGAGLDGTSLGAVNQAQDLAERRAAIKARKAALA